MLGCPRMSQKKRYWLFKSEPSVFSWSDLESAPQQTTYWEGVRNYQARNTLRDDVAVGDEVFFYHSQEKAIVGVCKVTRSGYPDHTAFDSKNKYYDPKSKKESPTWYMVDIQLKKALNRPATLEELKPIAKLKPMKLLQKGMRLSVQPVTESEWQTILKLTN